MLLNYIPAILLLFLATVNNNNNYYYYFRFFIIVLHLVVVLQSNCAVFTVDVLIWKSTDLRLQVCVLQLFYNGFQHGSTNRIREQVVSVLYQSFQALIILGCEIRGVECCGVLFSPPTLFLQVLQISLTLRQRKASFLIQSTPP